MGKKTVDEKEGQASMNLMEGQRNTKRQSPPRRTGSSRLWIGISAFFCITTFTLIGVLIWREMRPRYVVEMVVKKYPGLFRSAEEQVVFEQEYFNVSEYKVVNETIRAKQECYVNCRNSSQPGQRRRRFASPGQVTLHACCETTISFRPEPYLNNVLDQRKKIAQFDSKQQFFKFESCRHVTTFHYGTCVQRQDYVTAVTEDPDVSDDDDGKYTIEWLQVPGCCKCINVQTAPEEQ